MWEAIRSNHQRSWVLLGIMGAVLVAMGAVTGLAFDPNRGGAIGAGFALFLWVGLYLIAVVGGDDILLTGMSARKISKEDAPRLWNVVEEMTIASGLGSMPAVYVIESDLPNAFAVGRNPKKTAVAVTSGLLLRLNRDELQGVIAHEIGHIRNQDTRFMTLAAVMVGSIVFLSDFVLRWVWFSGGGRRRTSRGAGRAQLPFVIAAIVAALLAPLAARLLYLACSRRREYLADASSAQFTRYPEGLASALEKIALQPRGAARDVNRAMAPLFIVNPLERAKSAGLFSTHPPTEKRIRILRSMGGGAGYVDYERAFRRVADSGCLDARTLKSSRHVASRAGMPEADRQAEALERAREVTSFLGRVAGMLPILCPCGLHIQVPPGLKADTVTCPRCGRVLPIPAARSAEEPQKKAPGPGTLRYHRKGTGWESFRCTCGHVLQIGPGFRAPSIRCPRCRRTVRIE